MRLISSGRPQRSSTQHSSISDMFSRSEAYAARMGRSLCFLSLLCLTAAIPLRAQFKTLHGFSLSQGSLPNSPLVQGFDGNLYGTTNRYGAHGGGTVFKITPTGTITVLYNFCSLSGCADGSSPEAGLTEFPDGSFFGVTDGGGNSGNGTVTCFAGGCGTVFHISSQGVLTTLYSFCSQTNCSDGMSPSSSLTLGSDDNFYGIAAGGGSGAGCTGQRGCGTIFKITPQGVLTTLYNFCSQANCTDSYASGPLVQANDGNFYGTGVTGGANNDGTFFQITPSGTFTLLYSFCSQANCADGKEPYGLMQAADGNFYGTTTYGPGTVFKITPTGSLTTIYTGGGGSQSSLIQATDGNFYGTTTLGKTLFKLTAGGSLTVLHSFTTNFPQGGLVQATTGNLFGTTGFVTGKGGTVYEWITRLKPFAETVPTSGAAGSTITILGNSLTGATAVTFNGTTAAFTVVSATQITATVPAGATTGTVKVTTPTGTLSSNIAFSIP